MRILKYAALGLLLVLFFLFVGCGGGCPYCS